ncbi:hypothetical protein [Actinoplanes sp. L3-i22]|uniref:hypothetical protein n=1 Tax=Actinoplanes sp. L3-i22 TaxID=2836373 RepID=UPI001C752323|nr:hypothetical protein [Actinoplanes sp. L3-i22]BCY07999.1 hypothetical protein L3i22_030870 [Actinoplanes sp. L3-i22]
MDMAEDEPLYTTREERQVWVGLVTMGVSALLYYVYIVPELFRTPVAEIVWVPPLFFSVLVALVATIIFAIVTEVVVVIRRGDESKDGVDIDVRDREISRRGGRLATPILGTGIGGVAVLASLGADYFWIGNLAFLAGFVAAVAEGVIKIRLYRRGY